MILYYRRTSCLPSDVLLIVVTVFSPMAILEIGLDLFCAFLRPFSGAVFIDRRPSQCPFR